MANETTVSTLDELLKRLYASWEIENLVNLTFPALSTVAAEGSADLGGVGFYFPVRAQGNHAHAFIAEGGALPTSQFSRVRQAVVNPKIHVKGGSPHFGTICEVSLPYREELKSFGITPFNPYDRRKNFDMI